MIRVMFSGNEPKRAYPYDAGWDLVADHDGIVYPNRITKFRTGTRIQTPINHVALLFARSGLATSRGAALVNGVGVIDVGFVGEIIVALTNHAEREIRILKGERIAQLVILPLPEVVFQNVPESNESWSMWERGENGLGSTGA